MQSFDDGKGSNVTRRDLLKMIGGVAGGVAVYNAMESLGFAAESSYKGAAKLEGGSKGSSVVVLGAGMAGMVAAYELRKAGYKVTLLEYRDRAGGRCWSVHSGEEFTDLGGVKQVCRFEKGDYMNPGPWRIPYHHYGVLDYCRELKVPLDTFVQLNMNAYYHSQKAFGGKPQRIRQMLNDINGNVSELLSKSVNQNALDDSLTAEDKERLLVGLQSWGALDKNYRYVKSSKTSERRGYITDPGGGLMPEAVFSDPVDFKDLIRSSAWDFAVTYNMYEYNQTIFQPTGGMEEIAKAFARELKGLINFNTRVSKIAQDDKGVTVTCSDLKTGKERQVKADWCVCTIPLSILSQLDVQASPAMKSAISAVPYDTAFKASIQFKRRFWEEDERIFGGISYTDLPTQTISYPVYGMNRGGKGVVLAAYAFGPDSYKFSGMPIEQRHEKILSYVEQLHPEARKEYDNAFSVGWHRVPWTNGCYGLWTAETRAQHYKNLCSIDGRLLLAGEHASYIPAWIEGAVLSATDAVERLHKHVHSR